MIGSSGPIARPRSYGHRYDHQFTTISDEHRVHQSPITKQHHHGHTPRMDDVSKRVHVTEQMSFNRGMATFSELGAESVITELTQLDYRSVVEPADATQMTRLQRRNALRYLMYLKQKRCGRIKARGCADGWKQRIYKTKDETSSPTLSTKAVFLMCLVDAKEKRYVITTDIPGAFMHADIDEELYIRLEGTMAKLLIRVNPNKYSPYAIAEGGKQVIYLLLKKALYGTLQAALLFWRSLSSFLMDKLGFELNPYDTCVTNKIINGKQSDGPWMI